MAQDESELDGSETEGEGRPKKARTAAAAAAGGSKGRRTKAAVEPAAIEKDNIFFSASDRSIVWFGCGATRLLTVKLPQTRSSRMLRSG